MAIRGVLTTFDVYASDYGPGDDPLYSFQNHFPEPRTIQPVGNTYIYKSFTASNALSVPTAAIPTVDVTFPATTENVNLVETAITTRQVIHVVGYRWGTTQGINDPTAYNLFSIFIGDALAGTSDLSTVTITVGNYKDSLNADLPWRKIPWTILNPLSARR